MPKYEDKRTVRKFLLFPKCLDGEWRWFEEEVIEQVCVKKHYTWESGHDIYDFEMKHGFYPVWKDKHWVYPTVA